MLFVSNQLRDSPTTANVFFSVACGQVNNLKKKTFLEDFSPFCGATDIPVFWIHYLYTSWPAFNRFLRFTSGATFADLLIASVAAEPFGPRNCYNFGARK